MKRTPIFLAASLGMLALMVGPLAAGAAAAPAKAKLVTGTFVGPVESSDAYIGIVVAKANEDGRRGVRAYICDGQTIATWFAKQLKTDKNEVKLTSADGSRLSFKVTKKRAKGTVRLPDGTTREFSVSRAARGSAAGLYRAEDTLGGTEYLGGWVVLPDGTQRGAVKTGTTIVSSPMLNVSNPTVNVGAGNLQAQLVDPFIILQPF